MTVRPVHLDAHFLGHFLGLTDNLREAPGRTLAALADVRAAYDAARAAVAQGAEQFACARCRTQP